MENKHETPVLVGEPVYQFIVNNPDHDGYIEWADCNSDFYSKEPSDRRRILYTAPPIPVLKLPERPTYAEIALSCAQDKDAGSILTGAWMMLDEVMRLNGVKS